MSGSVHIIPAVLLDPENRGVAFGISLVSCIEAEMFRFFSHLLLVNGGHLGLTNHAAIALHVGGWAIV